MRFAVRLVTAVLLFATGGQVVTAGINTKEVGAVLIYPEYRATSPSEDPNASLVDTYISVTNDKSVDFVAHVEVISGTACDDCNFDLPLTGYQTRRLRFTRQLLGTSIWATVVYDASGHSVTGTPQILSACADPYGFVVITLEQQDINPRTTLGDNALHGDAVVVDLGLGTSSQVGAHAVQGVGVNDGDRELRFDNMEYSAFPSILTTNFWSSSSRVDPRIVLFNVNFQTGQFPTPVTQCSLNYANAEEVIFSRSFSFGCWDDPRLSDLAVGFDEDILGTANGFMWIQCEAGTHGAVVTDLRAGEQTGNYPYPANSEARDTLFQSVTVSTAATLKMTPSITVTETDFTISKTEDADPVVAGEPLRYTLSVTNEGPANAKNVTVTDTLPQGVTLTGVSSSAWSCSTTTTSVTCTKAALAAGETSDIIITVDVPASTPAGTILTNTADVAPGTTDPDTTNNSASAETTVITRADLSIAKVDDVDPVDPGETVTYTVTVVNAGPSDAAGVAVNDPLPAGLTLSSTSGCAEDPAGAPTCTLGTIPAGGQAVYTVAATVDLSASGTIVNTATVASSTQDPDPSDNTAVQETTVVTEADLSIVKVGQPDPVAAGGTVTYTIAVSNAGPGPAMGVVVSDSLPAALSLVATSGCADDPAGVPSCTLGTIGAGAEAVYTITAVADGGIGTVANTATVSSQTPDPDAGNNSSTDMLEVLPAADLSVVKTDDVDPVMAGGTLTYTVVVSNAGPSDAIGVVATDILPIGTSLVSTSGCAEDPSGVPGCSLGTIAASGSAMYSITVAVDPGATGPLMNTVFVTSATPDPDTGNNTDTQTTAVSSMAGLSVMQTDSIDPVNVGNPVTWTVTVANAGPSVARNVVATGSLPVGTSLVSSSGCLEDPSGSPVCGLGDIPAGGSAVYSVTANVATETMGPLSHLVSVTSSTFDSNLADNSYAESTQVTSELADLSVTITDNESSAKVGDRLTYRVTVHNAGPDPAQQVVAFDALPGALTLLRTTGCLQDPEGIPTCGLGSIPAGGMVEFTIRTQLTGSMLGMLVNSISVSGSTPDPAGANNAASDGTMVE